MSRVLLRYPGINADGEDNATLYNMRNHGGIFYVNELEDLIRHASQSYYEGTPRVPDNVFNQAVELLKLNDPNNYLLSTPGWGYKPSLKKVRHFGVYQHDPQMLTIMLEQRFPLDMLLKLDKLELMAGPFLVMPKYHGGAARAYYKDGVLQHLLTRGDGTDGLDIKRNFAFNNSVPNKIEDTSIKWVDGEIIFTRTDWLSMRDKQYERKGVIDSRDIAVLASEDTNDSEDAKKYLKFIAYDSNIRLTFGHNISHLATQGFLPTSFQLCADWKDFTDLTRDYGERARFFGDFDTDGFILRNEQNIYAVKF